MILLRNSGPCYSTLKVDHDACVTEYTNIAENLKNITSSDLQAIESIQYIHFAPGGWFYNTGEGTPDSWKLVPELQGYNRAIELEYVYINDEYYEFKTTIRYDSKLAKNATSEVHGLMASTDGGKTYKGQVCWKGDCE